jgi:intracellular sulfur oxidation DsrE/DsrF family protein
MVICHSRLQTSAFSPQTCATGVPRDRSSSSFTAIAAYLTLNDDTYNANRHVMTGNPFKNILSGLMEKGVQLELCGATAKGNHWGNANLLPGIKVNLNAMVRLTQLEQDGYTMIYE